MKTETTLVEKIKNYVANHIREFHKERLNSLGKLKLGDVLKRKTHISSEQRILSRRTMS